MRTLPAVAKRTRRSIRWLGALAGLLAAAVAVGIGQLIAGIVGPNGSPIVEVGQLQIDLTPPALKDFAVRDFGSSDKTVLVAGIIVLLALIGAVAGALAVRRMAWGYAGVGVLGAFGFAAVATRPASGALDAMPTLAAVIAAALTMYLLIGQVRSLRGIPEMAEGPAAEDPAISRRRFLSMSTTAAGAAAAGLVVGRLLDDRFSVAALRSSVKFPKPAVPVPPLVSGTDFHVPGLSSFVTQNATFYRVDTAIVVPQVAPEAWRLRIHGMVERELELSFDDVIHLPLVEDWITLCCVSNPVGGPYIGNALWLGARLAPLLRRAGIRRGADQLYCTSVDGFTSGAPVEVVMDGRDALLAVAMNGSALPQEHGFPVRLVVPGLYGYVSACKWITDIEVTTYANNVAYWSDRGWSQQAPIKTESRIDVPNGQTLKAGHNAVAGVAWAQHKGIEAVEVRIDRGAWQEASLARVPGIDCWRQWLYEWDAAPGQHLIEARATDSTGYTQTSLQAPPPPNGASGYPAVTAQVS